MRFDYTGRAQSEGRVQCKTCSLPMLGIKEQDPRKFQVCTWLSKTFCDCAETKPETASEFDFRQMPMAKLKPEVDNEWLKSRIKELEEALSTIAESPTWTAFTSSGNSVSHTYAMSSVDIARNALKGLCQK